MAPAAETNRELLETAERLVRDHEDRSAGAVLRCFARAVRRARTSGVPFTALPVAAEELARDMLSVRGETRAQGARAPSAR